MRRTPIFLMCLAVSIALLLSAPARAIPPAPKIPADVLRRKLLPTYRKQINQRLKWWKQMFIIARSSKDIIEARQGLLGDYHRYDSSRYRSYVARQSVKELKGFLEGKGFNSGDTLMRDKEVNLAIGFSQMSQRTVNPALTVMIGSSNEALRYLGWKGYEGICDQLLKVGPKTAGRFVKTLDKAVQAETSPTILRKIFLVMKKSSQSQSASTSVVRLVRKDLFGVFETAWPTWCKKVQDGTDREMIKSLGEAVSAMVEVGAPRPAELKSAARAKILQMLVNLAYNAAVTYDKALQAAKDKFVGITDLKTRDSRIAENRELQQACSELLLACEAALGKVSSDKKTAIRQALNEKADRGAAVRGGVLDWAAALKKQGVKDPAK